MPPPVAIASLSEEALDSERIVLGSLLMDPKLLSGLTVTRSDFARQHQPIFDAMIGLAVSVEDFDTATVIHELRRRAQLSDVGGHAYLFSLTEMLPRHIALEPHCAKIKRSSLRRHMAGLCERTLSGCWDLTQDPVLLLAELRGQAATIESPGGNDLDLGLISAADVKAETVEYLIDPYVPRKCLSLLVGDPGDGKTWVGLKLAADLTRGTVSFAGGSALPGAVLYLSNEDGPGELRARFDKLGGDPSQIWFESAEHLINLCQAGAIEAAVLKYSAVLVVIDTVTSHFGGKVDFHKASEVAAILAPLAAMGQRTGAAILGLMHLSKSMQAKSLYRVQGSTAFAGAARSVLGVGHDPSDPTIRILAHMKSNGSAQGSSRKFSIDDNGVTWGELSGLGAADVLGPEMPAEERSETSTAMEFLREALSQGSRDAGELKSEAKSQGIAERTLKRAKLQLGVKHRRTSFGGAAIWWLHDDTGQSGQSGQSGQQGDQGGPTVQ